MNFLAHLLISDHAGLPMAGGVLGDVVRGPVEGRFPETMARSIRLHRRVDTVTDSHPQVHALLDRFPGTQRRYAGVLLDLLFDHALAKQWETQSSERFGAFCRRSGKEIGQAAEWFVAAGGYPPPSWMFEQLLRSYALEVGMSRAIRRTAARLRKPEGLLETAEGWTDHIPALEAALPILMADLRTAADEFMREPAPATLAAPTPTTPSATT